jgi:hypothetical protein
VHPRLEQQAGVADAGTVAPEPEVVAQGVPGDRLTGPARVVASPCGGRRLCTARLYIVADPYR